MTGLKQTPLVDSLGFLTLCVFVCHLVLWTVCHRVIVVWFYDLKDDLLKTGCEENVILHSW